MNNISKPKQESYSRARIFLHWLIAIAILGLFASGIWMVELDYYHQWYTRAPHWHKSIGLLFLPVLMVSMIARHLTAKPPYEETIKAWERWSASVVQFLMSALMVVIIVTGYLITTANGDAVSVFNWFDVPAIISDIKNQEDISGKLHQWLAYTLLAFVALHAGAGLFHHFVKKDRTLLKMLSK